VSLKDDTGEVLLALGARESNADIAKTISLDGAADLLADLLDPGGNLLGVMRRRGISVKARKFFQTPGHSGYFLQSSS